MTRYIIDAMPQTPDRIPFIGHLAAAAGTKLHRLPQSEHNPETHWPRPKHFSERQKRDMECGPPFIRISAAIVQMHKK